MKRAIYISFLAVSFIQSACTGDIPSLQTDDTSCILAPVFMQGGGTATVSPQGEASRSLVTGLGNGGNGNISEIGVCITGTGHNEYLGMEGNGTRYTFKTTDGNNWNCYQGTGSSSSFRFILNGTEATLQAFHPADATVTEIGSTAYTIPVILPAEQTYDGNSTTGCSVTDYLYGSKSQTTGSAETVTANNLNASPEIFMQHALSKVAFKIRYDANRTPDAEHDCVKSIRLTSSANDFRVTQGDNTGTMQINNGTLGGNLTQTNTLTFTATSGTEVAVGNNNSETVVAYGLVSPLTSTPGGTITLTVTLGKRETTDFDREYAATSTAFKVQWKKGYCYTYNLVLGNSINVDMTPITWETTSSSSSVTVKEQGIGDAASLVSFAQKWNTNGDKGTDNSTFYKDYGWEEIDENGNKQFKIKLTGPVLLTGTNLEGLLWQPIGTETHPLTIPIDGQGWQIVIDLTGTGTGGVAQNIPAKYAGIIGYTKSDIYNLKVGTSSTTANTIEFTEAVYAGLLAGKVEGNIMNCSVELNGITLLNKNESAAEPMYFGGLVGNCTGSIINSAVYANSSYDAKLRFTKASTGSYIGGLAGEITGAAAAIKNCYVRVKELSNQDGNHKPVAGYMAGMFSGEIFSDSYYIANTVTGSGVTITGCILQSPPASGVTHCQDFTGLCEKLNAVAEVNEWSTWTEINSASGGEVESVFLFSYRNSQK